MSKMDRETFVEICETCFGEKWVSEVARSIGYTNRQVYRMASGEVSIKPAVAAVIIVIAKQKRDRLTKLIEGQDIDSLPFMKNKSRPKETEG